MKSSAFYAVLGVGFILMAAIAWLGLRHTKMQQSVSPVTIPAATSSSSSVSTSSSTASTTSANPLKGLSIYTNGEYGFSFVYPGSYTATTTFDSQYHLPPTWEAEDLGLKPGIPVVEVLGYHTENSASFPRYFESEVRVGMSTSTEVLRTCTKLQNGETVQPDVRIGGIAWKAFSFQNAGMMQYVRGTSYRTVHDGVCVALESLATGSSYVDAPSSNDIPQEKLYAEYAALAPIVTSFSFARP
jgi:hypothetical protein